VWALLTMVMQLHKVWGISDHLRTVSFSRGFVFHGARQAGGWRVGELTDRQIGRQVDS
jgi:hypothetical protein